MKKVETIELKQGGNIRVDNVVVGYTIEGPALVVVITEEAAAGTTAPSGLDLVNQTTGKTDKKWPDDYKFSAQRSTV